MEIDISKLILDFLKKQNTLTTSDIVRRTGFSRAYVHRYFKGLQDAGKILLFGRANEAHYVLATAKAKEKAITGTRNFFRSYTLKDLQEDRVWSQIIHQTGIIYNVPKNIVQIVEYGFTEMLNNAIDHSSSKNVHIRITRTADDIRFSVKDLGVGIFHHIKEQHNLKNEKEAIQDLLKGKQTTDPENHSGKGIFFTSRAAGRLVIKSSQKRLIFDNIIRDIAIDKTTVKKGTTVDFFVGLKSKKTLASIFNHYAGEEHELSKTDVNIAFYKAGRAFLSRSQARRILVGMEKFKHLVLDFQSVATIGQGFADEIFRIWKQKNTNALIEVRNANKNIKMMIAHVQSIKSESSG